MYQYALSNAHVTNRLEQAVDQGYVSAGILAGDDAQSTGWSFVIERHGEEDRTAYSNIDPATKSPPASPEKQSKSRYHPPDLCPADEPYTDILLMRVRLGLQSEIARFSKNRFFVPSANPSASLTKKMDIAVGGFPDESSPLLMLVLSLIRLSSHAKH